nr:glycoside hydrolase family 2 TIM barrel-domain containing protein [Prolixibacteraceae bacterium]
MKNLYLLFMGLALFSCRMDSGNPRKIISLDGVWQFALDTADAGEREQWYLCDLTDSVVLPGTTDTNHKGFLNSDTSTLHLNRVYRYEGPAWYRRKVVVPDGWQQKHISLILERTRSTAVWIDSTRVGASHLLQSPQFFDVSDFLSPGEHVLTIRVDNSLDQTPYGNVHIYSDDTQTNWNGILGALCLEARDPNFIRNLRVFPDVAHKKIRVCLETEGPRQNEKVLLSLVVEKTENGKTKRLKRYQTEVPWAPVIEQDYVLGRECSLWDEYKQPLYRLTATVSNGGSLDAKTVPFGMRDFSVQGTQFVVNGRTIFLRGKHEAAVFPLTGFPPMEPDAWERVFRIAKSYGINHYRFHSYCPPEAAFTAADRVGIYLQAELPFWGGLESDRVAEMLREEGYGLLDAYANHPSFVLFSHGNEIWSGHDRVEQNILALKDFDPRPLYTMGANNNIGYVPPRPCSDFFVAARTPYSKDSILTHTRLTHAFCDSEGGGILNTRAPATDFNFAYPVSQINIPLISHEIGQYQIYPDYREIEKYTGVLRARNLEVFRTRLEKSGMSDQDSAFQKASGAWSALCYKAEMEAALRTPGMAGFQLLDLQDFPGQGTALVGILDAFMDNKEVVSREEWLRSCNDVVLLLELPKYCWTHDERFRARVQVVNYSQEILEKGLEWSLKNGEGRIVQSGSFPIRRIENKGITTIGDLDIALSGFDRAEKMTMEVGLPGTSYSNTYPLWVYPPAKMAETPADIRITEHLDQQTFDALAEGGKVLFFPQPDDIKEQSYPGHFPPEFWNWGMFKGISERINKPVSPGTLGLLTRPDHPLFRDFPTDFHTNWQWFSILKAGRSFVLDQTDAAYRPVVQIIDNLERNHKLGLIFEFRVGEGSLLVCTSPVHRMSETPEA